MSVFTLTQLHYAEAQPGSTYRLYVYDNSGHYVYRMYFEAKPKYSEEEITSIEAKFIVDQAMERKQEVRITNMGDELVFHAQNGEVIYPKPLDKFWSIVGAEK